MKKALAILVLLPLPALAQSLGASPVTRYTSNVSTNKAWRRDVVTVRDGKLDDPTGVLVSKADVEFLQAVESGISQVYDAGSNGFKKAKADFEKALADNPMSSTRFIAMTVPPYTTLRPADKNVYGFLASETDGGRWFISRSFALEPRIIAEDWYVDPSTGAKTLKYTQVPFVDYFADATNSPAPYAVGDWDRCVRTKDPGPPVADAVVCRDHHLHFGNPETGFDFGTMGVAVKGSDGAVKYAVTGVYTDKVNNVVYTITKGAFTKIEGATE